MSHRSRPREVSLHAGSLLPVEILIGLVFFPREEQDIIIFNTAEQSTLLPSTYVAPQPPTTVESPPHSPEVPAASPQPETASKRPSRSLRSRSKRASPVKPTSTTHTPHLPRLLPPSSPPAPVPTASASAASVVEHPTTSSHEDILRDDAWWEGAPRALNDEALARAFELDPLVGQIAKKMVVCAECSKLLAHSDWWWHSTNAHHRPWYADTSAYSPSHSWLTS